MSKNFVAIWMLQSISKTTRAKNVNFWIFVPNHLNILFAKFSILCFHPQDERLLSVLRSKNRSALLVYLEEFHSKFFYFFSTDHSHSKVKTLPISFSKDAKCSLSDLSQENKGPVAYIINFVHMKKFESFFVLWHGALSWRKIKVFEGSIFLQSGIIFLFKNSVYVVWLRVPEIL